MEIKDNHITYIEFKARDLEKTKEFYATCFHWNFTDYGPTYILLQKADFMVDLKKLKMTL